MKTQTNPNKDCYPSMTFKEFVTSEEPGDLVAKFILLAVGVVMYLMALSIFVAGYLLSQLVN